MREVTIGEKKVIIAASPITLYIYNREFGPKADLLGDLAQMKIAGEEHPEDMRFLTLWKICWAMAKTAKMGGVFPDFESWLGGLDCGSFGDQSLWEVVLGEASRGFSDNPTTASQAKAAG